MSSINLDYDLNVLALAQKIFSLIEDSDENISIEEKIHDFSKRIDSYIETYSPQDITGDVELIFRNVIILIQNKFQSITSDECLVSTLST